MLRSAPFLFLSLALALPARADEPPSDEPMPNQQAPAAPPAQPAPPAPAAPAAPAPAAPAAAAPAPAADASVAKGPDEEVVPNPPRVYGWAFGGAAVGTLALSAILGGIALSKSGEQEGNASNPPIYTRDLQDQATQGRNLATTSYVFLAVGLALAVTDVVVWYETFRKPRVVRRSGDGGKL